MRKINLIKISLDLLMAFVFVLLFHTAAVAGLAFHEIAGLSIGLAFILPMALNGRWIRQVTRNLFGRRIAWKTRIGYFVDVLLLLSMFYTIFSGIMISKVLFPNLQIGNESLFRNTHAAVAYLSLGLVGWILAAARAATGRGAGRKRACPTVRAAHTAAMLPDPRF